jgi:hypothetical protein
MTFNGLGIRHISRVLQISTDKVQKHLLKQADKIPDVRPPVWAKSVEPVKFWSFVGACAEAAMDVV